MKTVVGLCGKMGSGKDTAAQILKLYGFKHLAFAWHIKKFAQEVFCLSDESLWGASNLRNEPQILDLDSWGVTANFFAYRHAFLSKLKLDDYNATVCDSLYSACDPFIRPNGILMEERHLSVIPRDILRAIGDWGRSINLNLWVNATMREAANFDKVVISDVRYENEANAINDLSCKGNYSAGVIKITRDNEHARDDHSSELEQDSIPDSCFFDIYNNNRSILALHSHLVEELDL